MAFRSRSVSAQQSRTAAPETTPTRTPGDHSERAPTARYGRPPGTPAHSWRSTEEGDLVAVRFPHYLLTGHLGRSMWVTVFSSSSAVEPAHSSAVEPAQPPM